MPSPSLALPSSVRGDRYINFVVGGQFNNHWQALTLVLWFARLLNRTVIIPSATATSLSQAIDLWSLSHHHPIICESDMPAGWVDTLTWGSTKHSLETDSSDIWYLTRQHYWSDAEQTRWIGHHKLELFWRQLDYRPRFIMDEFGPNSDRWNAPLLHYNQQWGYARTTFAGLPLSLFHTFTRWSIEMIHFTRTHFLHANRIVAALPSNFIGIHWRIADFLPSREDMVLNTEKIWKRMKIEGVEKGEKRAVYIGEWKECEKSKMKEEETILFERPEILT